MPLDKPGSLKPDEYLAIVAYVLSKNEIPAGDAPLTKATLKSIVFTSRP
jgi:hypothetical protein